MRHYNYNQILKLELESGTRIRASLSEIIECGYNQLAEYKLDLVVELDTRNRI